MLDLFRAMTLAGARFDPGADIQATMTTLLVTGGAGFIGSNFVHRAAAEGAATVVLDALTYAGNRANLDGLPAGAKHVFVHGSINDRALAARLLDQHRPAAIVNFAAESHVDRSIDDPGAFVRTNVAGTYELLEAALAYWRGLDKGVAAGFRFLHVSTDEVFGSIASGRFTEDSPYAPNSPYAATKAAADHLVRAFHRTYGLPTLITNCGNNYGPRQYPEKLIPHMIIGALEGRELPVYGDGQHRRDWLHVEDHCAALAAVIARGTPGETYNIGGAPDRTNLSIVESLCAALDRRQPRADGKPYSTQIAFVADRPGHDRRYALDGSKVAREIGWRTAVALDDGLDRTVAWYLDNRAWWQAIRARGYGGERLGLVRGAAAGA
jgi:dTDP-glucose 4,6-dehydratase